MPISDLSFQVAFLLPVLNSLLTNPEKLATGTEDTQNPAAIIVSPTRELAIQIYMEAKRFSASMFGLRLL